ncbi:MAG: DUF192 domain-containing protein [Gemmatimonadota bacterium]
MKCNRQSRRENVLAILLAILVGSVAATSCTAAGSESGGSTAEARPEGSAPPQVKRPPPDKAWVIFDADTVVAELARTPDERAEGLMYRDEVPDGTGMLFIFQDSEIRSFWMANTYVPLDIAYMDSSYRIVDIVQMEPLVTDGYPSSAPAMFALEVPQGWFAAHGVLEGATAQVVLGPQLKR